MEMKMYIVKYKQLQFTIMDDISYKRNKKSQRMKYPRRRDEMSIRG